MIEKFELKKFEKGDLRYLMISFETYDKDHRHYGGMVCVSDFNTEYRWDREIKGSVIARRIQADHIRDRRLAMDRELMLMED